MQLDVYKGFDPFFLSSIKETMLIENEVFTKIDIFSFDKNYKKKLDLALLQLDDTDRAWITYEEFSILFPRIEEAIKDYNLNVTIIRNNVFPDYYPIYIDLTENLADEILRTLNGDSNSLESEKCKQYLSMFNSLSVINGLYFGSYYNYEYDKNEEINVTDYYFNNIEVEDSNITCDYSIYLNDDINTYLKDFSLIREKNPSIIGIKTSEGYVSQKMLASLKAYCVLNNIRLVRDFESLSDNKELEKELIDIAKNDIGIQGFESFRKIKFYRNPDIDKEIIELSQGNIIQEIIHQAENSYNQNQVFRDIFITASTGAGKSIMFQIPAVYLAKKYKKLTIIIEPVKALMQDQKDKLNKSGYLRVEAFNSDLITQVEREKVLQRIKGGEVDLLYLSPETLLSYSIETIIGDREIGLLIIDEAHIVTTWGVGFRPDYWYLGSYINSLRNQIQTYRGIKRKVYHFPICACTATAINGGMDDTVSDTIISLYMENPIKYIGYVRRNDIKFEIKNNDNGQKIPKKDYERKKTEALTNRINHWLSNREKTIVYFPYASLASDASKGIRGFSGITKDKKIGVYTGRNTDALSIEAFNDEKRQTFESFRNGSIPIIFATKAFGMGVDVNDVKNVYHYAVTGNLCDYVQEIGRAARKQSMTGNAITDYYPNDISFMKTLFGMSQIKQYQVNEVLEGVYNTYRSKNDSRNFLISPESFTYIFNGRGLKDEDQCINKLKTCLLMLEKDFYDKYTFKVLISRPRSVFTRAFVCVDRDYENRVLSSKYGQCFTLIEKGRYQEQRLDGSFVSDMGDIYSLDLKEIWEKYYPNISFPQFKYWYFNAESSAKDKISIMPEIRDYFAPRQKISIEAKGGHSLSSLRSIILDDFEYIANILSVSFRRILFSSDDVAKVIRERFGMTNARIIANSLFELVDPDGICVKHRTNESTGIMSYYIANGNFKEHMRRIITKSSIVRNISNTTNTTSYTSYINLSFDKTSAIALKLLSVFNYISYEIIGGEEPEIFIRLNDPNKVKSIVLGETYYSNGYVTKAKQKHDRDVEILTHFFTDQQSDDDRWNYIEEYFLGYDVLAKANSNKSRSIKLIRAIDKDHSYETVSSCTWDTLLSFFDNNDAVLIHGLVNHNIPIPEYLQTAIKESDFGNDILMSWPSKNTLICQQDTSDIVMNYFCALKWNAYRIDNIDYEKLRKDLE